MTNGKLCEEMPEIKKRLCIRGKQGRPRLEDDQPELLKQIISIATYASASHARRNDESYRSVKTLNELTEKLKQDGFNLSRSGTYLRLIPKRMSSQEGKLHVKTVPVKLLRSQNEAHSKHPDGKFCRATLRSLDEIASVLGPNQILYMSQDDKARVPIGMTAAKSQAPLLMHVEYKVTLPDHDWVIAARHKLIPSVYAGITINENRIGDPEAVSYPGPTYIAISSGKHASSTAYSHALDFNHLLTLPAFSKLFFCNDEIKPVFICTVDGGPDENPRYQKVCKITQLLMKYYYLKIS